MKASWTQCVVTAAVLCVAVCCVLSSAQTTPDTCSTFSECGVMAECVNFTCTCQSQYVLHENGRDCRNASCINTDCLQCGVPDFCDKCVSFISVSTGTCLKKCEGSAEMQGDNLVCTESSEDDDDDVNIVVAVVAGVGAGAILCIIVIAAVCIYLRRTRRNINLQSKHYGDRQMDNGQVKQFPVYDNNAYESESPAAYKSGKIDPLEYVSELDKLRPHADTLMALLSQVRSKTRAMNSSDPRVPTYKGVIHQLCRVLVLIHKKDPVVSIPSDALGLIQWAHQMLEDHREQELSSSGEIPDFPIAQISSVDLDFDNPANPVYATPERSQDHGSSPASLQGGVATPYSTVPVPLAQGAQQQSHYYSSSGKRPGFATISRARSIPNGALISALDAEGNNTSTYSAYWDQTPVSHPRPSAFSREDLQNFLINNAEKSEVRNHLETEQNIENPQQELDTPNSNNQNFVRESIVNNANHNESFNNQINSTQEGQGHRLSTFTGNTSTFQPKTVPEDRSKTFSEDRGIGKQPSTKKNIITNPNAVKKSNSITGKNPKYAVPNIGYFANGHYYDPNPMPNTDAEVYAPGSNYSDRSNVMSTFLGDLPRSRSASSSNPSDGDNESENSGGDLDVFPFDLKDATEPVEV